MDDAVLHKSFGSDQLIVASIVHHIQDTTLTGHSYDKGAEGRGGEGRGTGNKKGGREHKMEKRGRIGITTLNDNNSNIQRQHPTLW